MWVENSGWILNEKFGILCLWVYLKICFWNCRWFFFKFVCWRNEIGWYFCWCKNGKLWSIFLKLLFEKLCFFKCIFCCYVLCRIKGSDILCVSKKEFWMYLFYSRVWLCWSRRLLWNVWSVRNFYKFYDRRVRNYIIIFWV